MKAVLSRYKYEIYFFYLVPALGQVLGLLVSWLIVASTQHAHWGLLHFSYALAFLFALGIAYPRVKRLDRPFLLTLWQGKMAFSLLELGLAFSYTLLALAANNIDDTAWSRFFGLLNTGFLVAVSSWYAVKVSGQGFGRAVAYVALFFFNSPNYRLALVFPFSYGLGSYEIPLLSLTTSMLLLLVAVSTVSREGYVGGMRLTLLLVASSLSSFSIWVNFVIPEIDRQDWWTLLASWHRWYFMLPVTLPRALHLVGPVSLAYLLYRYLRPLRGGCLGQISNEDSLAHVLGASGTLVKYHRQHKPFDWKIALAFLGVALMLSSLFLLAWPR